MSLDRLLVTANADGVFYYHADNRSVCDDGTACGCSLPSTAQQEAAERAEARADWYVMVYGAKIALGPVNEAQARQGVQDAITAGYKPQLLRVVEDYEA